MKHGRGNDNTPNTFLHLKRAKYRQIQLLGKKTHALSRSTSIRNISLPIVVFKFPDEIKRLADLQRVCFQTWFLLSLDPTYCWLPICFSSNKYSPRISITLSFRLEAVLLFHLCSQMNRNTERYWTKRTLPIVSHANSKDLMKFFPKTLRAKAESNDVETSFKYAPDFKSMSLPVDR